MFEQFFKKLKLIHRNSDLILAYIVVSIIMLLVVPLRPFVLDGLITFSFILAITTLLVTLYTEDPLSFSSFPSLLLFITLFRLGLNIASARMILTQGEAGKIIQTFGDFVTGGNQIIGFVLFILLTGINFVVITKGSGRVAEVAARFTLDAMPGKQMSIDADLNAGIIDQEEAQLRRQRIVTEADFYGAMDGASKFVRGDAIAGVVIILVILAGGFLVGMVQNNLNFQQASALYVPLTVGDGLVTQIPALLISVGAGIIVTRSSSRENLGKLFRKQLFSNPKVLAVTGSTILLLGLMPGMPFLVTFPVAIALFIYAYILQKRSEAETDEAAITSDETEFKKKKIGSLDRILFVDTLKVELGPGLSPLSSPTSKESLFKRIGQIRQQIALELGIVVPPIRIINNPALPEDTYVVKIKGNEIGRGTLKLNSFLAIPTQNIGLKEELKSPFWINADQKENAQSRGYILIDPLTVLTNHLLEIIRNHADELLNRQEVARLIDNAKDYASAVINEILPHRLTLGQILKILQNLLRERISIRDIGSILEILADYCQTSKDVDVLTEYVRQGLARNISKQYLSEDNRLHVITLDPKVEQAMLNGLQVNEFGKQIIVHPGITLKLVESLNRLIDRTKQGGVQPILMTTAGIRPYVKKLIERNLPQVPTLSYQEVAPDVPITPIGMVPPDVLNP
jgi:flagellar biosynthesis protein FlhA